ncbi:MAG: Sigma subunit DNA-directed polymerase [Chthoniobacter sp.]|nr:Sigma subunit DNA-directed polymerase [Chthoniobacter sp.]
MNSLMSDPEPELQDALATTLLANLGAFQGFARRRLGDDQLAADAVQESLLRALKSERGLLHDQNLLAWFYRILRNVLTDLHRRRTVQAKGLERFAEELAIADEDQADVEQTACACFRGLLTTMRPEYAQVLQLADLDGQPAEAVAQQVGITRNNLKVRLHRARRQLRERLEQTCQLCAKHGCLDCQCETNRRN